MTKSRMMVQSLLKDVCTRIKNHTIQQVNNTTYTITTSKEQHCTHTVSLAWYYEETITRFLEYHNQPIQIYFLFGCKSVGKQKMGRAMLLHRCKFLQANHNEQSSNHPMLFYYLVWYTIHTRVIDETHFSSNKIVIKWNACIVWKL